MKHSNLVVGAEVQAKLTSTCRARPHLILPEGAVFTVEFIFSDPDSGFRLSGETLGDESGYGEAKNFRKYNPEQEALVVKPSTDTAHQYKVGDKVLVGAVGAGNHAIVKEFAGRVCRIATLYANRDVVKIQHPDVMCGRRYTSKVAYLTPFVEVLAEGDIVKLEASYVTRHGEDIPAGLYEVRGKSGHKGCVVLDTIHGGMGQATVETCMLTKVGEITKEQDDGQA
jgi:CRISPR/Cas system CMR-associated protein Cmr5 small subunit